MNKYVKWKLGQAKFYNQNRTVSGVQSMNRLCQRNFLEKNKKNFNIFHAFYIQLCTLDST